MFNTCQQVSAVKQNGSALLLHLHIQTVGVKSLHCSHQQQNMQKYSLTGYVAICVFWFVFFLINFPFFGCNFIGNKMQ